MHAPHGSNCFTGKSVQGLIRLIGLYLGGFGDWAVHLEIPGRSLNRSRAQPFIGTGIRMNFAQPRWPTSDPVRDGNACRAGIPDVTVKSARS